MPNIVIFQIPPGIQFDLNTMVDEAPFCEDCRSHVLFTWHPGAIWELTVYHDNSCPTMTLRESYGTG